MEEVELKKESNDVNSAIQELMQEKDKISIERNKNRKTTTNKTVRDKLKQKRDKDQEKREKEERERREKEEQERREKEEQERK